MITAVIIDDEKHCIETLTHMVAVHCKQSIHLLESAQSVDEGEAIIRKCHPQLVFLDVEIDDKSGFDLLSRFSEINFEVIFTTAHSKYAPEAFNFSAIHFLLKPIESIRLKEAIERLKDKISKEDLNKKIETLSFNLNHGNINKRMLVPSVDGYACIQISDIIRCEAASNYSNIYLQHRVSPLKVAKTLSYYDDMLSKYDFCRVHQSNLVNMNHIKSYNRKENTLTLSDQSQVIVSARRSDEFLKALKGDM